jgi:hypothetical protein
MDKSSHALPWIYPASTAYKVNTGKKLELTTGAEKEMKKNRKTTSLYS